MRLQFLGGSYTARSVVAVFNKCINYFPEANPQGSDSPETLYQRPGQRKLSSPPTAGPARGIFQASNGQGYAVVGANVYSIGKPPTWTWTRLGTIANGRTNPVSLVDNGITALLVDGSTAGWTIQLGTNIFAGFTDPTNTFKGANRVEYIDTFVLWNLLGTNQFGSTLSNVLTIDPTYIAGKTNWPDPLQTLIVTNHFLLLFGSLKSEIWYDAGNSQFPFAELPGTVIEFGIVGPYALANNDISTYWLAANLKGQGMVMRYRGYQVSRVSNHALEYAIRQMYLIGIPINDAIGYCYQEDGHTFIVFDFPSGDQSWALDEATGEWSQRGWTDQAGTLHRTRGTFGATLYGYPVCLDWETGDLLLHDLNHYMDDYNGQSWPIQWIRSGRCLPEASFPGQNRQPSIIHAPADGKRLVFQRFVVDMECGTTGGSLGQLPGQVSLRWSDDRGKTFGNTVLQSTGRLGEYSTYPQWQSLGIARDRVWEISHSLPGPAALQGAWVDATLAQS